MTRTKKIIHNPMHYQPGMAGTVYGDGKHKIKKQKVITRTTPKKTVVKTVNYSPISYYGKQTKTKTKIVTKK